MGTLCIHTFEYDELEESAKKKAIEDLYDINTNFDWWDSVVDDAKQIGAIMGIEIENIYFSGFSSQGDGACFEGFYRYNKGSRKELKDYAPVDEKLHRIVQNLFDVQRRNFYALQARIKHSGHYYHKYCTDISVERDDGIEITSETEKRVTEILRDFMEWIYRTLEKEHDYLHTREAIEDTIQANDYKFTEEGKRNIYL